MQKTGGGNDTHLGSLTRLRKQSLRGTERWASIFSCAGFFLLLFASAGVAWASPSAETAKSTLNCSRAARQVSLSSRASDFSWLDGCVARSVSLPESLWRAQQPGGSDSAPKQPMRNGDHRFWERKNGWLFAAVGASRALDYTSTLNFRRRGRDEIFLNNDTVDNHPAFAAIEAGATAVSIGASYLFHRYHHHRLERWTSIVHASLAFTGDVRNYCLKTAHPSTGP
jgi:hypothetical protein